VGGSEKIAIRKTTGSAGGGGGFGVSVGADAGASWAGSGGSGVAAGAHCAAINANTTIINKIVNNLFFRIFIVLSPVD
jgi:hypothetical protein